MSYENGHSHHSSDGRSRDDGPGSSRSYAHDRHLPVASGEARGGRVGAATADDEASSTSAALELGALWEALRQGWWLILLATVVVAGGVAAYTYTVDPVYRAGSIASVDTRQTVVAFDREPVVEQHSLSSEIGYLQNSVALAERVVEQLQETAEAVGTDKQFPLLEKEELTMRERARALMERTSFEAISAQEMIYLSVESTSPEEAASIANIYLEEYQQASRRKSRGRVTAAKEFLQKQVDKREQRLRRLQGRLTNFAREKQTVTQGRDGEALVAEYRALQRRRDQAQFDLEQERVSLKLLQKQLEQARPELEGKVLRENQASGLQEQITSLNQRIAGLKAQAEEYYAVDSTRRGRETGIEELESIEDRIAHFSERKKAITRQLVDKEEELRAGESAGGEGRGSLGYVARLRSRITEAQLNIRELESQISALDERLASYDGRLQSLPRQSIERDQLERKIARAEQWHNAFVERLQQVQVAEESELGYVQQVRSALVPRVPVRPDMAQNVILGLLLGLGLGTGLAFVRSASDQRLKDPKDVEAQGYDLVGVIPDMGREIEDTFDGKDTIELGGRALSTSLMTLLNPWSPVAENFRLIKANLHGAAANGAQRRVLLVTSPSPADGKSIAAANLAAAMAQGGRRTLLIDADLRRPRGHHLFGRNRSPGLADLLVEKRLFRPEELATGADRLSFLPAGAYDRPPGELLESPEMGELMSGLRKYYDVILLDSPPVLAVTDAMILAGYSDAAVVVVAARQTDASALRITQDRLRAVGTQVAGTIINRVDPQKGAVGKGGYEYGYYQQYADGQQPADGEVGEVA